MRALLFAFKPLHPEWQKQKQWHMQIVALVLNNARLKYSC